ncbi:hypothetical protein ACFL45_05990 [Candidatus Neomarinimicrobiota bacterium]
MARFKYLVILFTLLIASCNEPEKDLVLIRFDIQDDFRFCEIAIKFNGVLEFSGVHNTPEGGSGPVFSDTIDLPRGNNDIHVTWRGLYWQSRVYQNGSDEFILGDADEYHMMIDLVNGELVITVQEEAFIYD